MSPAKKIGVLLVSCYLFLYMFPFPLDRVPGLGEIFHYYKLGIEKLAVALGAGFFDVEVISNEFNGSGDTTLEYLRVLTLLLISIVVAPLVFLWRGSSIDYKRVFGIVAVYARYYIGLYMIFYGFAKLFDGQFSTPSYGKLEQKLGDSSPMGLLWAFMGSSGAYSAFSGCLELLGGYLILFRPTRTVGALVTLCVMVNVAMLNLCYDVPVKQFSLHLVLLSMFILAPDGRALYDFFILHKTSQLKTGAITGEHKPALQILKAVVIVGISLLALLMQIQFSYFAKTAFRRQDGVYVPEVFALDGDTLAPLAIDSLRWRSLIISHGYSKVTMVNDSVLRFKVQVDTVQQEISFLSLTDSTEKYTLKYAEGEDMYKLSGRWQGRFISAKFRKKTYADYELNKRGFQWINEIPYNR